MSELREYQISSISKLRESMGKGNKRIVLYLPTGAGKTRVAVEIIRKAQIKRKKVAFICNRIELVKQTSAVFEKAGVLHGIVQGSNSVDVGSDITVCSINTVARRGLPDCDIIIIDECHGVPGSEAYKTLITKYSALPVIGLTATPFTKGMGEFTPKLNGPLFQDLIVGETISALIDLGHLVDVEIYAPSEPDLSGVRTVAGDYDKKQLGEAVDKAPLIGNIVENYIKLAMGKRAIVFATNVSHSQHVVEEFIANGIPAKHVDGYMDDEERRPIIDAFKAGEFSVLSNCSLLSEGFDCPETEAIILARPTKSLNRFIQMVGRALRPFDEKTHSIILDHAGVVKRLGFPTDDLPLFLDDGKSKDKAEPQEKLPKVCKKCYFVYPRKERKCPSCGFEPVPTPTDVATENGDLVKIKKEKYTALLKQQIMAALVTKRQENEAKGKFYNPHWIGAVYKDITGVYPRGLPETPGPMIPIVENYFTSKAIAWAAFKDKRPQDSGMNPRSGQDHCPKCAKQDYNDIPGKGPHHAGRKCRACNAVWWLKKPEMKRP